MSSPESYETGRGMPAHNEVMQTIRSHNEESYAPDEPTKVWFDHDRTPDGKQDALTVVLNTGGCRWARAGGCTMCGYVAESTDDGTVSHADIKAQVEAVLDREATKRDEPAPLVKIYSSGSVLDDRELSLESLELIADTFADRKRIVLESLPDFVTEDRLEPFTDRDVAVDVAIGVETSSDRVRRDTINKYFDFADVVDATLIASDLGIGVKSYLLLKPPFLTEQEAIEDAVKSVRDCAALDACHTVSVNPTTVQRYTMVDRLHYRDGFRPPWLWSIVAVLKRTADVNAIVMSDPVGAGSDRGPHNCKDCDDRVETAIKDFSLRGDPSVFAEVDCSCEKTWEAVCERERGFSVPLA